MPVPDFQSLFIPMLRRASDGNEHPITDLREGIAAELKLTPGELSQKLPSGTQTVFVNRVAWSTVWLTRAGALERLKPGVFRITDRGRELLRLNLRKLTVQNLSEYPDSLPFHKGPQTGGTDEPNLILEKADTPEEQLASAHKVLRDALANEILEAVKKSSSTFFEELVIDLLVAMGYGGSAEDAGRAVGKSGDGGIDGIIKEDKLGLDIIYVQAKRWANSVGRPNVQAFAGSLEGFRAIKGVFITTSYFSQEALNYVQKIEKRIILIDGKQLADLMIDYDIGVTTVQTYRVKRLDSDYFDAA